jgi:hypothetical protein
LFDKADHTADAMHKRPGFSEADLAPMFLSSVPTQGDAGLLRLRFVDDLLGRRSVAHAGQA